MTGGLTRREAPKGKSYSRPPTSEESPKTNCFAGVPTHSSIQITLQFTQTQQESPLSLGHNLYTFFLVLRFSYTLGVK